MKFIVLCGNPMVGFRFIGLFDTVDEANAWADDNVAREYDWWVMPVEQPKESNDE